MLSKHEALGFYKVRQLFEGSQTFSIKLAVELNAGSELPATYFWDRWHTLKSRFDLAFELLRMAFIAHQAGVYFQHFWHPDLWAWIETVNGGRAVFMGFHDSLPTSKCAYVIPKNTAFRCPGVSAD